MYMYVYLDNIVNFINVINSLYNHLPVQLHVLDLQVVLLSLLQKAHWQTFKQHT